MKIMYIGDHQTVLFYTTVEVQYGVTCSLKLEI